MPEPYRSKIAATTPDDWNDDRLPRARRAGRRCAARRPASTRRSASSARRPTPLTKWNGLRAKAESAQQTLTRLRAGLPSADLAGAAAGAPVPAGRGDGAGQRDQGGQAEPAAARHRGRQARPGARTRRCRASPTWTGKLRTETVDPPALHRRRRPGAGRAARGVAVRRRGGRAGRVQRLEVRGREPDRRGDRGEVQAARTGPRRAGHPAAGDRRPGGRGRRLPRGRPPLAGRGEGSCSPPPARTSTPATRTCATPRSRRRSSTATASSGRSSASSSS